MDKKKCLHRYFFEKSELCKTIKLDILVSKLYNLEEIQLPVRRYISQSKILCDFFISQIRVSKVQLHDMLACKRMTGFMTPAL